MEKAALFDHLCALAEPLRVRLLHVLARDELGVGELAKVLQSPQSTVSRHLKVLLTQGWVDKRQVGTSSMFRIADPLPARAAPFWEVVSGDLAESGLYDEDLRRADHLLAQRQVDSRDFFGRHAGRWDTLRTELYGTNYVLPTLLAMLPPHLVVADLGCGTGEVVADLASVVAHVYGVDQEAAMLEVAGRRTAGLDNVDIIQGDLSDLPLPDTSIDIALCMLVLHHVSDLESALRAVHRTLRLGGRLVVLDMVAHDRREYRRTMGHQHLGFSPDTLSSLATAAGLACLQWRRLPPEPEAQGPGLFLAVFEARARP